MRRITRILAGSLAVVGLCSAFLGAATTPRAGLDLIPDNSLNWGVRIRNNYNIEDSTFGVLGMPQTWTAPNTFSSAAYITYGTPGQCVATDANNMLITQSCASGGSGTSTLAVYKDGVQVSSPTAILKFNGNQFRVSLPAGNTAQVDLNPSTTYFIQNTPTLQSGSTFYVSSGTVVNLNAGTALITSGTYTNATISGPTFAYSSGTVSVALAVGTSSVNGQPLRVVDTTGNGVISFESPLSTTTMTLNLKNATAGSSAGLVATVQGATDAPTGAVAGDAIVRATNKLFLESGGPTSGRGIAISTNGVSSVYYADGSTSTSASTIRPDLIQMPSVGSTSSPLILMTRTGGPVGFNYFPIEVFNSFYLDNVGFQVNGASGTAVFQVSGPRNVSGLAQGSWVQTGDVEIPIGSFGAAPSSQNIWIHKYSFTQPFGTFTPNTDYGVRISSKGVAINPGFLPLDQAETFHIGSGTTTPNASSMIMAVSTNSAGTMGVITNSHQFYAGIVSTYAVVGSTSATDVHVQANGTDQMVVSSLTGVTVSTLVALGSVYTPTIRNDPNTSMRFIVSNLGSPAQIFTLTSGGAGAHIWSTNSTTPTAPLDIRGNDGIGGGSYASLKSGAIFSGGVEHGWKLVNGIDGNLGLTLNDGTNGDANTYFLSVRSQSHSADTALTYVPNNLNWTSDRAWNITAPSGNYIAAFSTSTTGSFYLKVSTQGVTSVAGAFQLLSQTSVQIKALTPSAVGQEYYCSDCATVAVCISTGTGNGAFALITSKTSACQ